MAGSYLVATVVAIVRINAAIQQQGRKLLLHDKEIVCVSLDHTCAFQDGSDEILAPDQIAELLRQCNGTSQEDV